MFSRLHCCTFVIGIVLVLLAVGIVVHVEFTTTHQQAHQYQRAHVAQAVSYLEDKCLACHTMSADVSTAYAGIFVYSLSLDRDPVEIVSVSPLQERLLDAGQRILVLPESDEKQMVAVTEEFLQIYEQVSVTPDQHTTQLALWRLDGIEDLLRTLEHRASPYQLARQDHAPDQSQADALHTNSTVPDLVALQPVALSVHILSGESPLLDASQFIVPLAVVFATRHRGPPAGAFSDSVFVRESAI